MCSKVVLHAAFLLMVNCTCSSKGALTGIKDPGPLQEAIAHGDLSTAKKLLGIAEPVTESETGAETESGEHKLILCELIIL